MDRWFKHQHKSGSRSAWTVTIALATCTFLVLYGVVGFDSLLQQDRQSADLGVEMAKLRSEQGAAALSNEVQPEDEGAMTDDGFGLVVKRPMTDDAQGPGGGLGDEVQLGQQAEDEGPVTDDVLGSLVERPMTDDDDEPEVVVEDDCVGRYVYMYDLPQQYNTDLIEFCTVDENWPTMCKDIKNGGLGQPMLLLENNSLSSILQPQDAWYITNQFNLGIIFHERMKNYSCLTNDPKEATFSYVPFYSSLDLARTIFAGTAAVKDRLSERLIAWLENNEHWRSSNGHKHVFILARIIWDYARKEEDVNGWGSAFLSFPEVKSAMKLSIERSPWSEDQVAIPYPTSFHPSSDEQIRAWQQTIETVKREMLVLFAGAPRNNMPSGSLRGILMQQCEKSENCAVLSCRKINCAERPDIVTGEFLNAVFCLQPSGDSATRKGVFDCLLAGGIPVFFDKMTAPLQYLWHLPSNSSSYSVLFDQNSVVNGTIDVINELENIPQEVVVTMQKSVRDIVPGIIYRKPGYDVSIKDAFDLAIDNLLEKFIQADQTST